VLFRSLGTSVGIARTVAVLASLVAFAAAMTGHAAGDETHEVGTSTMLVHLLAVGIWLGGLAVLQTLPPGGRDDQRVVRGYSHLALICWVALALSGVWALAVRMNQPGEILTSAYVQLGLAEAVLLLLLGGRGALPRGGRGRARPRHLPSTRAARARAHGPRRRARRSDELVPAARRGGHPAQRPGRRAHRLPAARRAGAAHRAGGVASGSLRHGAR